MNVKLASAVCAALCALSLGYAEEQKSAITAKTTLDVVLATTLETKATLAETVKIPLLVGASPLVSGNNLQLKGAAELSPVSVNGTFEARLTPIAFLQFYTGGSIGSGWNIPIANGLRKNTLEGVGTQRLVGGPFDGMVWSVKGGGLFQFDLAALIPGDWTHVVFQTAHQARYRALTSASGDESWLYESDEGENRNGWGYYGNYFLGYQMPLFWLNTTGMLFEEDIYLYDTANRKRWGDDLSRWTFGPLFNLSVSPKVSAAILVQWRTRRNYTDETKDYTFYQSRVVRDSDQRRVEFYRAALNVTIKLR